MDKQIEINEIQSNTNLVLHVSTQYKKIEIPLTYASTLKDGILIEPIMVSGKIVNFKSKHIKVILEVKADPLPYFFNKISIGLVERKGKKYHKVMSGRPGKVINRRENYRVYIGLNGTVKLGNKNYNCIVKDLSETGFSFILKDSQIHAHSFCTLRFNDDNKTFVLCGAIIRHVELDKTRCLYGCVIKGQTHGIEHYLALKQQERIRIERG